jgi:hypothetical protein
MRTCTPRILGLALLILVAFATLCIAGQEPENANDKEKELRQKRLDLMHGALTALTIQVPRGEAVPKFVAKPLLRYSDPVRQLVDAGVWRLGERGRPRSLVTMELYRKETGGHLSFEFLSLTDSKLTLEAPQGDIRWSPEGNGTTKFTLLKTESPPAANARLRLAQMKEIARRFRVSEDLDMIQTQCRLLINPIDRYADEAAKIADGGVFAYAHGTNPEVAVLLECDAKEWRYAIARLTSAAIVVELDGMKVFESPQIRLYSREGAYSASGRNVEIP